MNTKNNHTTIRFWNFVDKNGPLHKVIGSRCWIWKGGKIRGYGHFWCNGKTLKAHRFALQISGVELNNVSSRSYELLNCNNIYTGRILRY